ncbi:hypothetical protein HDV05_004727 [Chytridiales sp. JEL 0842]|nr:hypothetical protein HDV05_004727 [Chytridiales sp. JEL 0842]
MAAPGGAHIPNMSNAIQPKSPILSARKSSIVEKLERTGLAIESKLTGSLKRSAQSSKTDLAGSQASLLASLPEEINFTMDSNDYELGSPIGFGSSAIAYTAKYKPYNKTVAVKVIDLDMFERNQIDELRREIQIMSLSKHPNLLPVYGSFVHDSKLQIVTPFLSAGSCLDIMKTAFPNGLDEGSIATILKQTLQGLDYLHKNGLIHRDVKAGNLLLAEDGLVQLADFGVSSSLMDSGERKGVRKTFVGTPCWMAPEVMEQSGYDYKADIWSLGITALELATGHAPFAKYPPLKVLMLTLQNDPPTLDREHTSHKYSKSFKDMIDSCLQKDPAKRPTAEKLLQHSFFKQVTKKTQQQLADMLQSLPPVSDRSHNKRSFPQIPIETKGVSWDFDSADDTLKEAIKERSSLSRDLTAAHSNDSPPVGFANMTGTVVPSNPEASSTASSPTTANAQAPNEIRKGRFSVTEGAVGAKGGLLEPSMVQSPLISPSIMGDVGGEQQRKSRFAVQTVAGGTQSGYGSQPGSAPGSMDSTQPRTSRFTVRSNDSTSSQGGGQVGSATSAGPDKRGRFEVSAVEHGQSTLDRAVSSSSSSSTSSCGSPQSSPCNSLNRAGAASRFTATSVANNNNQAGTPSQGNAASDAQQQVSMESYIQQQQQQQSSMNDRLDTILRQNERQKALLGELIGLMAKNGITIPDLGAEAGVVQPPSIANSSVFVRASENVEHLMQENGQLRQANDALKASEAQLVQQIQRLTMENEALKAQRPPQ